MTGTTPVAPPIPKASFGADRVLMLVFGSLLAVLALAFLAGGGAGVWAGEKALQSLTGLL